MRFGIITKVLNFWKTGWCHERNEFSSYVLQKPILFRFRLMWDWIKKLNDTNVSHRILISVELPFLYCKSLLFHFPAFRSLKGNWNISIHFEVLLRVLLLGYQYLFCCIKTIHTNNHRITGNSKEVYDNPEHTFCLRKDACIFPIVFSFISDFLFSKVLIQFCSELSTMPTKSWSAVVRWKYWIAWQLFHEMRNKVRKFN